MAYLPRGIDPALLLSQVKNTMPYLFDSEVEGTAFGQFVPAAILRTYSAQMGGEDLQDHSALLEDAPLSHLDYFKLCVSCHYLTCATPVPTDVDNQIRFKLWPAQVPLDTALEMARFVLSSRDWDFTQVSTRWVRGPVQGASSEYRDGDGHEYALSGHLGEWFTVASAAYCAMGQYGDSQTAKAMRSDLFASIEEEVRRHSETFGALWRAEDGLACLRASANIAHNFGDLDRVMDMWELSVADPLRLKFYKLGTTPFDAERKLRYLGRLWVAGELYKSPIGGSSMALENHRHFALRKPRSLRRKRQFLIPFGPFFDDWGREVAGGLAGDEEAVHEVIAALGQGWTRLPKTVGYGRALLGLQEGLRSKDLSALFQSFKVPSLSQKEFEKIWNDEAIAVMEDIPSRA